MADAHALGLTDITSIDVADLVFVGGGSSRDQLQALLVDPLLQTGDWSIPQSAAIETALLPGVTDAAAQAVALAAETIGTPVTAVATGTRYEIGGDVDDDTMSILATRLLANQVIERWSVGPIEPTFVDADATADTGVEMVEVDGLDDNALLALNRERGLSLDLAELHAIVDHFRAAGRAPTDVELETLAQTWSEHCAHKSFRARITATTGRLEPLLHQLRDTTIAIDAPFVRLRFDGNAGIVSFRTARTLGFKAETHNHPSAIEPFGGANTGVGGVIRDVIGAAHRPIAVTDILCFGPADIPADDCPMACCTRGSSRRAWSPASPTTATRSACRPSPAPCSTTPATSPIRSSSAAASASPTDTPPPPARIPGDRIVVLGGRTGRDGIRGATFS